MTTLVSVLVFCQAFGAVIGTFTAVWSEISYAWAMRDRRIDEAERNHLRIIGHGLRFGLLLLLVSSLGLVIAAYVLGAAQPALSAGYWVQLTLVFIIIVISWNISRRRTPYVHLSAIAFTAWWFMLYLTLGQLPALSFGAFVSYFVIATGILYLVLAIARYYAIGK